MISGLWQYVLVQHSLKFQLLGEANTIMVETERSKVEQVVPMALYNFNFRTVVRSRRERLVKSIF